MKRLLFPVLLILSACGYRVEGIDPITVTVPYVLGDHEGELTDALAFALSKTANYRYVKEGGDWTLTAKIVGDRNDRIGYRYDRDPKSGKLRDNVIGIENRKDITVEVKVVKTSTGDLILGPQKIKASSSYDYEDPNTLFDLETIDPASGIRQPTIDFSLGQLDSVAAAGEDVIDPIYRLLAQRIIDGMIAAGDFDVD